MKIKILVKYLSQGDEKEGVFFLEKRSIGKFLCYKRGEWEVKIKLTKKTFKNLSRFSKSTLEKECEVSLPEDEDVESCCGVYFDSQESKKKKRKTSYHPASKPHLRTKRAPIILQWFICSK